MGVGLGTRSQRGGVDINAVAGKTLGWVASRGWGRGEVLRGEQEPVHEMGACTERKFERGWGGVFGRGTGAVQGTSATRRQLAFWRPTAEGLKRFRCSAKAIGVRNFGVCHGAAARRWCGRPLGGWCGASRAASPCRPARHTLRGAAAAAGARGLGPRLGAGCPDQGIQREQPSRAGAAGSWGGGTGTAGDRGAAEGSSEGEARPAGLVGDSGGRLPAPSLDWMPNCAGRGGGEGSWGGWCRHSRESSRPSTLFRPRPAVVAAVAALKTAAPDPPNQPLPQHPPGCPALP